MLLPFNPEFYRHQPHFLSQQAAVFRENILMTEKQSYRRAADHI